MPTLQRIDAEIYFEIFPAKGEVVTLLNGFMRPCSDFKLLSRFLVEQGFAVILIDHRGAGKSKAEKPFTANDMVEDILAVWREANIVRSHLVGISMGGMLAQILVTGHREKINRLVLVSTAADIHWNQKKELDLSMDAEGFANYLKAYVAPSFFAKSGLLIHSMAKQMYQAAQDRKFVISANLQREAIAQFNLKKRLGTISVQTLIIHGRDDQVIPLDAGVELRQLLKGRLEVYDDAGHLLLAERPEHIKRDLVDFFSSSQG